MIFRKPYAFFIKHFRLIHVILATFITYLLYLTLRPLSFLNEYIASEHVIPNTDLTAVLFDNAIFYLPIIIIVIASSIFGIMLMKEKKVKFYILIIVFYLIQTGGINYAFSVINEMETTLLDIRTIRLVRDVYSIMFILQVIISIFTIVRAIGFDFKNFNFKEDLEELEITEEDNEEFEVDINFDSSKVKTTLRRNKRFFNYYFIENKNFLSLAIIAICFSIIAAIYFYDSGANKVYNYDNAFTTNRFTMKLDNMYLTRKGKSGDVIVTDGMSLIVLDLKIKSNAATERTLDMARTHLNVDGFNYYPVTRYRSSLTDLGTVYDEHRINNEFSNYLLVYEVPIYQLEKKILFTYDEVTNDEEAESVKVSVSLKKLDEVTLRTAVSINETALFNESNMGSTEFIVNDYSFEDEFKVEYRNCYKEECYDSYEYAKVDIIDRDRKTVMYLDAELDWDITSMVPKEESVMEFLNTYGKIKYIINGKEYNHKYELEKVILRNAVLKNNYFIEVDDELKDATSIDFIIQNRFFELKYRIK